MLFVILIVLLLLMVPQELDHAQLVELENATLVSVLKITKLIYQQNNVLINALLKIVILVYLLITLNAQLEAARKDTMMLQVSVHNVLLPTV